MAEIGRKMKKNKQISPRQMLTIPHLSTKTTVDAAKDAGVSERSIHRWLKDPIFIQELRNAEEQILKESSRKLAILTSKAIDVAGEILLNPETSDGLRLRSATIIFDQNLKIRGFIEIKEKVEKLEELYNEFIED